MGLSLSWIAVQGRPKQAILDQLELIETGRRAEPWKAKLSYAELHDGWLVVQSNNLDYASPERIAQLSQGGLAVGCLMEEHVMFSGLRAYEDGRSLWSVIHDADEGISHLQVGGRPPTVLAEIRERLEREQAEEDAGDAQADFIFGVPVELAKAVCGYRGDLAEGEENLVFTELKPRRVGLIGRLFGGH